MYLYLWTGWCRKNNTGKKIADTHNMDYFVSSGSNDVLDGYCQQPCIILDDIRPSALGLSDLLKLTDPHTPCSVKSRYKNKYVNCELIILTSVLKIDEFYHNVFEHENEPINQLKRRCKFYIRMDSDFIRIRQWDNLAMRYGKEKHILMTFCFPSLKIIQLSKTVPLKKFFRSLLEMRLFHKISLNNLRR